MRVGVHFRSVMVIVTPYQKNQKPYNYCLKVYLDSPR